MTWFAPMRWIRHLRAILLFEDYECTVRDSDLETHDHEYGETWHMAIEAAYSTGRTDGGAAEAQAAEVSVLAFDPDDYIIDFGSPITVDFTGKTELIIL